MFSSRSTAAGATIPELCARLSDIGDNSATGISSRERSLNLERVLEAMGSPRTDELPLAATVLLFTESHRSHSLSRNVVLGRIPVSDTTVPNGQPQAPPPTGGAGEQPPASEPSGEMEKSPVTPLWIVILIVYMVLFASTGYVAFFTGEFNPAFDFSEEFAPSTEYFGDKQGDYVSFVIDSLKQDGQMYEQKRKLASQSFNVVLGAILGFLSASAAIVVGRQRQQPS